VAVRIVEKFIEYGNIFGFILIFSLLIRGSSDSSRTSGRLRISRSYDSSNAASPAEAVTAA
jgi:hypothetical protein